MKLELKHLVGYLPYGLKSFVDYNGHRLIKGINVNNVMCIVDGEVLSKPILRPLSDLTKEIEVNGEKFVPIDFFIGNDSDDIMNAYYSDRHLETIPYNLLKYLFEWHFDVFGLIEKDLAIDINTL